MYRDRAGEADRGEPVKHLDLIRPLVFIDIESTGVDPVEDRILQFGAFVMLPFDSDLGAHPTSSWEQTFNPGMRIPADSTAIHGITEEMVADKPAFADYATRILRALEGKDIAGYNLRLLDLPILDQELRRCGLKLDLNGVLIVDSFGIFANKEPRDLAAAVKKFTGVSHNDAHGAMADAAATMRVLIGQREHYEDLSRMTVAELAEFSKRGGFEIVDLAGKLYRDKDGDVCYAFGQRTRGIKVRDDIGFADWILRKDFPGSTKEALLAELERLEAVSL